MPYLAYLGRLTSVRVYGYNCLNETGYLNTGVPPISNRVPPWHRDPNYDPFDRLVSD